MPYPIPAPGRVKEFSKVPTILVAASDAPDKVKQYADYVCDGVDDDLTIESAINALPSVGGKVVLSEGNFVLGSSIDILKSNVSLEGSGPATVIKGAIGTDYIRIGDGTTSLTEIKISNLKIDGSNQSGGNGIYVYGEIHNEITKSVITNCWIYNTRGQGIYTWGAKQSLIESNIIHSRSDGIFLDASPYCMVASNYIYDVGFDGITVGYEYCTITGNYVYNPGEKGIYINGSLHGATIVGNLVYSPGRDAIKISSTDSCVVVGNLAWDVPSGYYTISVDDASPDTIIALNRGNQPINSESDRVIVIGNRVSSVTVTGANCVVDNNLEG